MHVLVASGGLAQYEINAFLFHAVKQGPNLSLALLDTFCRDLFITGKGLRSEITGKPFFVKRHTLNHAMRGVGYGRLAPLPTPRANVFCCSLVLCCWRNVLGKWCDIF
jgi:hypothetical protein